MVEFHNASSSTVSLGLPPHPDRRSSFPGHRKLSLCRTAFKPCRGRWPSDRRACVRLDTPYYGWFARGCPRPLCHLLHAGGDALRREAQVFLEGSGLRQGEGRAVPKLAPSAYFSAPLAQAAPAILQPRLGISTRSATRVRTVCRPVESLPPSPSLDSLPSGCCLKRPPVLPLRLWHPPEDLCAPPATWPGPGWRCLRRIPRRGRSARRARPRGASARPLAGDGVWCCGMTHPAFPMGLEGCRPAFGA